VESVLDHSRLRVDAAARAHAQAASNREEASALSAELDPARLVVRAAPSAPEPPTTSAVRHSCTLRVREWRTRDRRHLGPMASAPLPDSEQSSEAHSVTDLYFRTREVDGPVLKGGHVSAGTFTGILGSGALFFAGASVLADPSLLEVAGTTALSVAVFVAGVAAPFVRYSRQSRAARRTATHALWERLEPVRRGHRLDAVLAARGACLAGAAQRSSHRPARPLHPRR
jgi:hypothetical protein